MSITIAEALKIGALRKCKLVAGFRNTDNVVFFVDSMEVPDINPWLKSNELLITTGYSIKDDKNALLRLIESLASVKAAGLAIKPRFMGVLPSEVIELAERLNLPLIEIPEDVPFIEITHPLMKAIASRQTKYLEFSETAHRALTKVELEGSGLEEIAQTLQSFIGNIIIVTDYKFRIKAMAGGDNLLGIPKEPLEDDSGLKFKIKLKEEEIGKIHSISGNGWIKIEKCPWTICIRPSRVKGRLYGFIFVVENEKPLKALELIALEHASTTISLEFTKQELVEEHIRRIEYDFFTDLLMGNVRSREGAMQRARILKWPQPPWVLFTLDINDFESVTLQKDEIDIQKIKDEINNIIQTILESTPLRYTLLAKSDSFTCLYSSKSIKNTRALESLIEKIQKVIIEQKNLHLSAGISGQFEELLDLPDKYQDARTALKICKLLKNRRGIGHIDGYMLERTFLEIPNKEILKKYYGDTVGKLQKYDQENGSELVRTLQALVDNSGLRSNTAKQLFLHRNTLAYRLQRIEKLTGLNLARNEDLLNLAIALKIRPFI